MLHRARQTLRFGTLGSGVGDRQHAERTAAILRALGADAELIEAGRLHDIAKPRATRLWHRVAGVLLGLVPAARARLARGDSTLARYLDHPARGAEQARQAGTSERVVALIARHHDRPRTPDERLLAQADREAVP